MQEFRKFPKAAEGRGRVRAYEFGPFRVDLVKRLLYRNGDLVSLTPKALDTLAALLEHDGDVLLKEELIGRVWPDTVVEEGSLNRNISTLRKALGESPTDHRYIVTVPGRGYRFVGEVHRVRDESPRDDRGSIGSLAVLPFLNLTGDPDQEYVSDGLTEALITDLAQIRALHVVSRTSIMRYKNTRESLPAIARELGVEGIVEGSLMREGRRVRITVQLIEAKSDRHLWARTYEGELGEMLDLQSAVARAILREIRAALTPAEEARLSLVRVVGSAAYEAYLRGRHYWNQRTFESLRRSEAWLEQAIAMDSRYAQAHVALAQTYLVMLDYGMDAPRVLAPKAMRAVERAIVFGDDLGEAHGALALSRLICEWDFAEAERQFRQALELNPGDSTSRQWYGVLLMYQRRFEDSLRQMREAQSLDPLAPIVRAAFAFAQVFAGRYREALAQAETVRELEPRSPQGHSVLGMAYQQLGDYARAINAFEWYVELSGKDPDALMRLGCARAAAGEPAAAREIVAGLKARRAREYVSPGTVAAVELALGNTDEALAGLAAGVDERATSMLTIGTDPVFADLRSDARFRSLLERIGLPSGAA
jgi:TolB-like protein/Flp pilus assembly protein TadD